LITISKKRVLINVASGVITRLLNITFVFWLYQYLLKRVPPEEFAIYPVLIIIMMLVPVFASFFAAAVSRAAIEAYALGRPEDVRRIHASTVVALSGFLLCFLCLGLIGASQIDRIINVAPGMVHDAKLMAGILFCDLCLALFAIPFSVAFEVRERFLLRDVIMMCGDFLKIALIFSALVFVSPRVLWVVLVGFCVNVPGTLLIIVLARRMLPEFRVDLSKFDPAVIKQVLSFGFWTSLGQFSVLIYQNSAPILLNLFSTPVQVNSYFIGSVVDRRMGSTISVALAPVQPALTAMSVTGDWRRTGNTYLRGGRLALWAAMAIATPLFVFTPEFITLYLGDGHEETAMVMAILLAAFPLTYSDIMLPRIAIATGKVRGFFSGAIVASLVILACMWIAIRELELGAVGAALSVTFVILVSHLGYFWPLGLRLAGVTMRDFANRTLLPGLLPSIGGLLVWLPLKHFELAGSWLQLFLSSFAGGGAYIAVLVIFCLQPDERRGLALAIERLTGRPDRA
jgi:O-antigen/teichoic acid export membrane protein